MGVQAPKEHVSFVKPPIFLIWPLINNAIKKKCETELKQEILNSKKMKNGPMKEGARCLTLNLITKMIQDT